MFTIIISTIVILSNSVAYAQGMTPRLDPNKLTFCHVTINSDDEKKMFEKKLTEQNKDKFQHIELTEMGNDEDWFKNACESKVSCDILSISGHFGGSFFGDSGLSISSDDLENAMCSQSCQNILSNPVEVYLWGCNTLAGKQSDSRTPEEYREVLIHDGYSNEEAERIAALRYSPIGTSFRDQMQRVFRGVPHLYGFKSIAPLGKNVAHMIENYLDDKGDYSAYLALERSKQLLQYLEQVNDKLEDPLNQFTGNLELYEALKVTHFTQIVTQTPRCGDELVSEQSEAERVNCILRNDESTNLEKFAITHEALDSDNPLAYILSIYEFIKSLELDNLSKEEEVEYQKVVSHAAAKKALLETLDSLIGMPRLYITSLNLAEKLQWMSKLDARQKLRSLILPMLKPPVNLENRDLICSLELTEGLIKLEDVSDEMLNSNDSMYAISCLKPVSKEVKNKVVDTFYNTKPYPNLDALRKLGYFKIDDLKVQKDVVQLLSNDYLKSEAIEALYNFEITDESILLELSNYLNDELVGSTSILNIFENSGVANEAIHLKLSEFLDDSYSHLHSLIAGILAELPVKNKDIHLKLANLVNDPETAVNATYALMRLKPNDPVIVSKMITALDSEDSSVVENVVEYFKGINSSDEKVHLKLAELLKDNESYFLDLVLDFFTENETNNREIHLSIVEKLTDSNYSYEAQQALKFINFDSVVEGEIIKLLDRDDTVNKYNILSIFQDKNNIPAPVFTASRKLLNDESIPNRIISRLLLSKKKGLKESTVNDILNGVNDSDKYVRYASVVTFAEIGINGEKERSTIMEGLLSDDMYLKYGSALALFANDINKENAKNFIVKEFQEKPYDKTKLSNLIHGISYTNINNDDILSAVLNYLSFMKKKSNETYGADGDEFFMNNYSDDVQEVIKIKPCSKDIINKLKKLQPNLKQTWNCT